MTTRSMLDMKHTEKHLKRLISKEKYCGDYFLASVVQDSLLYNLHHHADSAALIGIAEDAAQMAVQSVIETMDPNEFAVSESVRGVMHSMVTLGGDPIVIAISTSIGGVNGVKSAVKRDREKYVQQIVSGITSAAEDLGMDCDRVHDVTKCVVKYVMA